MAATRVGCHEGGRRGSARARPDGEGPRAEPGGTELAPAATGNHWRALARGRATGLRLRKKGPEAAGRTAASRG